MKKIILQRIGKKLSTRLHGDHNAQSGSEHMALWLYGWTVEKKSAGRAL